MTMRIVSPVRQAIESGHLNLAGRTGDTIRMVIEQLLTGGGDAP